MTRREKDTFKLWSLLFLFLKICFYQDNPEMKQVVKGGMTKIWWNLTFESYERMKMSNQLWDFFKCLWPAQKTWIMYLVTFQFSYLYWYNRGICNKTLIKLLTNFQSDTSHFFTLAIEPKRIWLDSLSNDKTYRYIGDFISLFLFSSAVIVVIRLLSVWYT